MKSKEGEPRGILNVGDRVLIQTKGLKDTPKAMEVIMEGDKRVIAVIGSVQLTESSYTLTLKPQTPMVEPQTPMVEPQISPEG